ncbi:sel1 repeat family protein [Tateyamaria sp. syn59]|uniref:sel1 repeat family protein n=1 Tax=Tateyamaria sp. syn59 TaxID=2576942 RepID=UPI0011BD4819|nr:sel1 repeat family protein [Tateyamaria sp. syn59]
MFRALTLILALTPVALHAQAAPLDLDFLPPPIAPRDVCVPAPAAPGQDDLTVEGTEDELTDRERIRYLRRDIRNYTDEDADRFFAFISALIVRRAEIDDTFTDLDAAFARIELMLRAGRMQAIADEGAVVQLRDRVGDMTNTQRLVLSRYYQDGIGVAPDPAYAQTLLREAAFGGSADALLEIARLEQEGRLVEGWDAPLDLTVNMAFGGILGGLDRGVCRRAARIAQEYIRGDLVAANPAHALAWFRFAADMGGAEAAWRVVEFHLNADADQKDNIALRAYLERAVQLGVAVDDRAGAALVSSGAVSEDELAEILGFNHSQDDRRTRASITPLLQLVVNIDGLEADDDGPFLQYLREIAELPEAPGRVFDRLAGEVLVRKGRWAGEAEAMALLEEAVRRGDGPGQRRLAGMLVRYRDDPAAIVRAENLLTEAVSRHGMSEAMRDLDSLYRCQINDAPRLALADPWAAAYRGSGHANVTVSATDLLALSLDRSPEAIGKIQSLALERRIQMVASHAQRVQANPLASSPALRFWASELNRSDQALEAFAELEFELATTPAQRDLAIEFFRRVYLNNGVTSALDLAIALVEYNGRDPEIADEIVHLLTMAGNRGEGAAIRLLSRLQRGTRTEAEVFAQFADKIEARGDFLALMFAIPHIGDRQVDDYIDRAVSLMNCGTKDADELGDAYAIRGDGELSYHWRTIGLHFEGGHVLSKLRLSNRQMGLFDDGAAPDPVDRAERALASNDPSARYRLIQLTANPDLSTYDPEAAVEHLLIALISRDETQTALIAEQFRLAPDEIRDRVRERVDVTVLLERAAAAGDRDAAYELGMLLRDTATASEDLAASLKWLETAAGQGHRDAMFEAGFALGLGLGRASDRAAATALLDQASALGHPRAAALARSLRLNDEG